MSRCSRKPSVEDFFQKRLASRLHSWLAPFHNDGIIVWRLPTGYFVSGTCLCTKFVMASSYSELYDDLILFTRGSDTRELVCYTVSCSPSRTFADVQFIDVDPARQLSHIYCIFSAWTDRCRGQACAIHAIWQILVSYLQRRTCREVAYEAHLALILNHLNRTPIERVKETEWNVLIRRAEMGNFVSLSSKCHADNAADVSRARLIELSVMKGYQLVNAASDSEELASGPKTRRQSSHNDHLRVWLDDLYSHLCPSRSWRNLRKHSSILIENIDTTSYSARR